MAHIWLILLLLLLGIIGLVVWTLWSVSNKDPEASISPQANEKIETSDEAPPVLERLSSTRDSYSVVLPSGWVHRTCEGTDILFLAPNEEELGKCNSGYFGAISISRNAGDVRAEGDPSSDPSATEISVTSVTIDGQPATQTSYTVAGEESMIPVGTRLVRYQIFFEGNTYTLGASQAPGGTSYASELDAIVRSFRFSE